MHKMKLIQAHTLTHLHTRIAKYAHKGVCKMYSPFYVHFILHTDLTSPPHTHLFAPVLC